MSTIKVFDQNFIDLFNGNVSITITDTIATDNGQSIVNFMRNRSLNSAWITTGSTDAALTEILVDLGDVQIIKDIIIIKHNMKNFVVSYWNGVSYTSVYSTSTNTDETTWITNIGSISTNKIKIVINGTMAINDDKFITRLLITSLVGSFIGFPVIKAPKHGTNKGKTQLLSGLTNIVESTGSFSVTLGCDHFTDVNDLALIETIYNSRKAFNFCLCCGDDTQFTYPL
jgi:hypothetical protein